MAAIINRSLLENQNKAYRSLPVVLSAIQTSIRYTDPNTLVNKALTVKSNTLKLTDIFGQSKKFSINKYSSIYVVAAGKAAAKMTQAVCDRLGARIKGGAINVPYNYKTPINGITVTRAGHPFPDQTGVDGTRKIISILGKAKRKDLVIVLISGGGSALMPLPADDLSIENKQMITHAMMSAGLSIHEMNVVRKHLSKVKGGQLLRFIRNHCTTITLILSDVIGDDLGIIASGPTFPDNSTFADAAEILKKYNLWEKTTREFEICKKIITQGINGILSETLKPGDPLLKNVHNFLIGNNEMLCKHLTRYLKKKYDINTIHLGSTFDGQAKAFGRNLAKLSSCSYCSNLSMPFAFILGGETTVSMNMTRSNGIGGRNQEAILSSLIHSRFGEKEDVTVACFGSDGIDGNSEAAGAFITPRTHLLVKRAKISLKKYLYSHDSFSVLERLNSTIRTGLTETNVGDIAIVCRIK